MCNFKLKLENLLYTHNPLFSWISVRRKIFIINFFFKILTCNYFCSHLQVQLGKVSGIVTLFFYFSRICTSGSSALLCTLHSPPIGFNLMTNFSGIRLMEFHGSGWFLKYQPPGITATWSMKFQKALHPFTLSMNWAKLHSRPLGHLSNGFQGENLKK